MSHSTLTNGPGDWDDDEESEYDRRAREDDDGFDWDDDYGDDPYDGNDD